MAVTYSSTVKTNRLTVVNDALSGKTFNEGTGVGSPGYLVIGTSSLSGNTGVLAVVTLENPAATVSGNTLTLNGVPINIVAADTGIAALAELRNGAQVPIVTGLTVDTTNADIIINSTEITSGQLVTLLGGTITHG